MIMIAEIFIIILIFLTILLQRIDLNINLNEELTITVSSTLFSLELKNPGKNTRKRKQKFTKSFSRVRFFIVIASDLITRSYVNVRSFKPFEPRIAKHAALLIFISVAAPQALLFLENNAAYYEKADDREDILDISFSFQLIYLFISLVKASYYRMKSKFERRRRNVG